MQVIGWIVRAVHVLAATAWVGGSIFYLVAALPALRNGGSASGVAAQMAALFKRMVNICAWLLLLSGMYLTFERLTQTTLGLPYLLILAFKVAAALGLFILAIYLGQSNIRRLAKRTTRLSQVAPQLMLALGILIFLLGALLNGLFEVALATH